jgi:soluble cytochrome b562
MAKSKISYEVKHNIGKSVLWTEKNNIYERFGINNINEEIDENSCELKEGTIKELSPSKKYVKINRHWYHIKSVHIIEILRNADEDIGD